MPKLSVMDGGSLTKLIASIGKRKVALDQAVQDAAVQCVIQSIDHRNATPAMQLFDALEKSVRRDALVVYFETFGNLAWKRGEKKGEKAALKFQDNARVRDDEFDAKLVSTLWYTMKPEPQPLSQFDVSDAFDKLIDRARKLAKRGVTIINGDVLAVMETAYAQYQSAKVQENTEPEIQEALEARAQGKASPAQLAKLTEHFGGRSVTQVRKAA